MKFRKKPVVIEAIQYNGCNYEEISNFTGQTIKMELESETAYVAGIAPPIYSVIIKTLEGDMKAMPSDWIIKGVIGEFYPCKKAVFDQTYDLID